MNWLRTLRDRYHAWNERRWRAQMRKILLPKPDKDSRMNIHRAKQDLQ